MDLFKFPFIAEIWGTISDWIMILVTSITAYFLYKTLKSQREVQQAQNKLLAIEQIRLREDFKPNLKYSRFTEDIKIDKPDKALICIAVRNVSVNPALNIDSLYIELDPKVTRIIFKPNPRTLTNESKYFSLYYLVDCKSDDQVNCQIWFTMQYDDVAGNKYNQAVMFDSFAGREEFKTYDPKLIEEKKL